MKKLLLLIPLVFFIIGCGGEEVGTTFFPLAVGNIWEYMLTQTMTTPDTTIFGGTGTQEQEITAETTLDNGTEVFEQVTITTIIVQFDTIFADTSMFVDTTYIQETENYLLMYDSKDDTEPDTMAALPPEIGKSWNTEDSTTATYVGQESVTVPAGTFSDCWKIAIFMPAGDDTTWFYVAEDVGMVKMLMTETDADTAMGMLLELEDYDVE